MYEYTETQEENNIHKKNLICVDTDDDPVVKNVNRNNPVLLISLDGFRASKLNEFLNEYPNSTLKRQFVDVGVKADSVYKFYII